MITGSQIRAARMLLGIDQKQLAELAGVSVPTVQRMEARKGSFGGAVGSLARIVEALEQAGVELIAEGAESRGRGRGVRLLLPAAEAGAQAGAEAGSEAASEAGEETAAAPRAPGERQ
ncbi:MAG: helix-turn-helix domain-containing protein [Alphaproteobacteria bacterium]|nr:MAG: helix-turn-helix domain-containing protein [Alphaproteobacteria bacterium]